MITLTTHLPSIWRSHAFPKTYMPVSILQTQSLRFTLGCHELSSKLGFMYCWDEVNGSKGSQEIAACLLKHIEARARLANHVVMYSDTCTGQNRNWKTDITLMKLVQSEDNNIFLLLWNHRPKVYAKWSFRPS